MFELRSMTGAALAAALLLASPAQAQDNGIYFGGSMGDLSSDFDWNLDNITGDESEDTPYKLIGGVRPFDSFGLEVNYVDLGNTTVPVSGSGNRAGYETNALSVSAVGFFHLPLLDVFGRVGLARWDSDPTSLVGGLDGDDGTDPTYGIGAQVRLGSFAVRAEYEDFDVQGGSAELASIGFTYTLF